MPSAKDVRVTPAYYLVMVAFRGGADGQVSHSKLVSSWLDWAAFAVSTSRAQWCHGSLGPAEPEERNQCKREAPSLITKE